MLIEMFGTRLPQRWIMFQNNAKYESYSWVQHPNPVTILWLTWFDDWFDFYRPLIKKMRNSAPRKYAVFFLLGAQIQNGRRRHFKKLTFEPEQLESSSNTYLILSFFNIGKA